MNHAYFVHHNAVKAYKEAVSPIQKRAIAMTYFEQDAELVDSEMKKKLEEKR